MKTKMSLDAVKRVPPAAGEESKSQVDSDTLGYFTPGKGNVRPGRVGGTDNYRPPGQSPAGSTN